MNSAALPRQPPSAGGENWTVMTTVDRATHPRAPSVDAPDWSSDRPGRVGAAGVQMVVESVTTRPPLRVRLANGVYQ